MTDKNIVDTYLPSFDKSERRHNWLYSVVPIFSTESGIYLAGYCKDCRNGFTVRMLHTNTIGHVLIYKLGIPTTGCEPVD